MKDKITESFIEALRDIRGQKVVRELLHEQTQDIVSQISENIEKKQGAVETNRFKLLLEQEKNRGEKLERQIKEFESQIDTMREENRNYVEQMDRLHEELRALQENYDKLQRICQPAVYAYDVFGSLSDETRKNLSNIFVSDSFEGFMAACFDWNKVEGIRNYIRNQVIEHQELDVEKLQKIFRFMFAEYNAKYREPQYSLICPEAGTKFISEEQVILGTRTDGILKNVCLEGYKDSRGTVLKKALVEV